VNVAVRPAVPADAEACGRIIYEAFKIVVDALSFLLPVRQANLLRWCLSEGFGAVLPMTLMAMGKYQEPASCYMPSILY
jgi:hypothetical protein